VNGVELRAGMGATRRPKIARWRETRLTVRLSWRENPAEIRDFLALLFSFLVFLAVSRPSEGIF
jgi:hypothetical protein